MKAPERVLDRYFCDAFSLSELSEVSTTRALSADDAEPSRFRGLGGGSLGTINRVLGLGV